MVLVERSRPFCVGRDLRARGALGGMACGHPRVPWGLPDDAHFGTDNARRLPSEPREEVGAEVSGGAKIG